MKPILILGGSGFIGHTLYKELAPFFEVKATYYTAKGFRKNQNFYPLDLENEELSALLREVKPKLIISALRGDFDTQIDAHNLLCDYVKKHNSRILFLSSANVFDTFRHYPSYEYDKTFSESVYGKIKIKIENQIMRLPIGKYVIARLPMIFGKQAPRVVAFDKAIVAGAPIEVFPNTIINVNSDSRLSQQIHYIINQKKTGIYHLGSSDLISHYEFVQLLINGRHKKAGRFKQVFTSNQMRYLATLPKENKLPNHLLLSYSDVLNDCNILNTKKPL
ncbi:MAG: sugar nucleotide-binding protein [Flavobacteriaceae bacterium]|nr:sugar nucleotide-binding protein [Flavobacteriaceae bacterium]